MEDRSTRLAQYLGIAIALGFGVGTAAFSVWHALGEEPAVGVAIGVVPPFLISLAIVGYSVELYRGRLDTDAPWYVATWLLGGAVVGAATGLLVVTYQHAHGGVLVDQTHVVVDSMVGGGGVGTFVGHQNFRQREQGRELATTNQILDTIREVNRQIATADDAAGLERAVCETLAAADPYVFAWVGERDGDAVVPRTAAGIETGYLESVDIRVGEGSLAGGPAGTAVRTREPQVVLDVHEDDRFEPWRDAAVERGFRSVMSVPLVSGEGFYGVLNVYANRTGAFEGRERAVLEEVGDTLAEALVATELRESRGRLLDGMDDAVFVCSLDDGRVLGVNETAVARLGYAEAELLSMRASDVAASHDAAGVDEWLSEVRREGRLVFDAVHRRKDGTTFPVEVSATTTTYHGQTAALAIVRDVTERKRRERSLQTYREAVDHAGHAIYITDTDGTIEYVNPAFERQTGYSREEVVGETPAVLGSGRYDDAFYADLWETILDGEVWHYDGMVDTRRDGSEYYVDQTIAPIEIDGEVVRFVAVNRDITELKEYQETLEDRSDRLELLNQLVRHDIRNDMQVVLGMSQLLEAHVDDGGRDPLEAVVDHSRHVVELTRTVGELMTTLLVDDEADVRPVPLARTLDDEVAALRTACPNADVRVDGEIPAVDVAANEMLDSVFRNVLNNAVQHNRSATPEVVVSATADDDAVTVRVADDGPGIPADRRDEIFGKGERGLESGGTGLGLYLVQTLVDHFGGDVSVRDNEPCGSVFEIRLRTAD